MSLQKNDRTFQSNSRKSLQPSSDEIPLSFAHSIAGAMRTEWGATPSARKHVCRITGANERAVRNWFEAKNGPSGENLVHLLRHSEAVLATVLRLADRSELLHAASVMELRAHFDRLMITIEASGTRRG